MLRRLMIVSFTIFSLLGMSTLCWASLPAEDALIGGLRPLEKLATIEKQYGQPVNVKKMGSSMKVIQFREFRSYIDNDKLTAIFVRDNTLTTQRGIRVGMRESDVLKKYGNPDIPNVQGHPSMSYKVVWPGGYTDLDFLIKDGVVTGINAIHWEKTDKKKH